MRSFKILAALLLVAIIYWDSQRVVNGSAIFLLHDSTSSNDRCYDEKESNSTFTSEDGLKWKFYPGKGYFCQYDDKITIWLEASRNDGATHQLRFQSNNKLAVFEPINF